MREQRLNDASDPEVSALWREATEAADGPPPVLDAKVLAAAHAAVAAAPAPRRKPWWTRLALPVSVAAVAILGLSVTLRVADEDERRVSEELREGRAPRAVPAAPSVSAPSQPAAQEPVADGVESARRDAVEAARRDAVAASAQRRQREAAAPVGVPAEPAADPVPAPSPSPFVAPQRVTPSRPAPYPESAAASDQADLARAKMLQRESSAAAARAPRAAEEKAEAARRAFGADYATPTEAPESNAAAWLARIRELRDGGRIAEAKESLRRFRAAFPQADLPDDLARDERLVGSK